MFERYTESARRALFFARYEVSQLGAASIEVEHLLLGVSRAASGVVARVLIDADLSTDTLRREIAGRASLGDRISTSVEIPFSRATQRVLQFAAEEADRLAHAYIGVEHLLLGVLREDDAVAAPILQNHGVKLDKVRLAIETMLAQSPPVPGSPEEAARHVAREIDQLKASLDSLAVLSADSSEAREIRKRIRDRLEELKRYFPNEPGSRSGS
jgi:ATP-dependent Clp protease ATP-binding subunit ClpC